MNPKRDKFLTEVVLGECWHKREPFKTGTLKCSKCSSFKTSNPDFSTPEGFFKLWNACKEKEWWILFFNNYWGLSSELHGYAEVLKLIHPDRLADAVYEFMKERR